MSPQPSRSLTSPTAAINPPWRVLLLALLTTVLFVGNPPSALADTQHEAPKNVTGSIGIYTTPASDDGNIPLHSVVRVSTDVYPTNATKVITFGTSRGGNVTEVELTADRQWRPRLDDAGAVMVAVLNATLPGYTPLVRRAVATVQNPPAPILSGVVGAHEVLPGDGLTTAVPQSLLDAFPDATVTWEWQGIDSTSNSSGVVGPELLGRNLSVRYTLTSPTQGEATSDWSRVAPVVTQPTSPVSLLVNGQEPTGYQDVPPRTVPGIRHEAVLHDLGPDDEVTYRWDLVDTLNYTETFLSDAPSLTIGDWWGLSVRLTVRVTNPAYREAVFTHRLSVEQIHLVAVPEPDRIVPGSRTYRLPITDIAGPVDWEQGLLQVSFDRIGGPAVPRGDTPEEVVLGPEAEGREVWVRVEAPLFDSRYYSLIEVWVKIGVVRTPEVPGVSPKITGEPRVGNTLTLTVDHDALDHDVEATTAITWYADGKKIATGTTLDVTDALRGKTITVGYTVTAPGHVTHTSDTITIGAVPELRPITGVSHTVTGEPRVGNTLTLTVDHDALDHDVEATTAITWYADGEKIATGTTLDVTDALRGKTITVGYTVTAREHIPHTAEPITIGTVPAPTPDPTPTPTPDPTPTPTPTPTTDPTPTPTPDPTPESPGGSPGGSLDDEPVLRSVSGAKVQIAGKAYVGSRLTTSFNSTPRVTASVVWTRGAKVVGRGASYTVKAADAGSRLTATATVEETGYQRQTVSTTTATVTAPVSLKVSVKKVKRAAQQTLLVGKVSKGQAVTVRVNGKVAAKATVRGNGRLASVRTVRTNGAKVTVKASGKTGFSITFRVAAKKGTPQVTAAVAGRPTAKATYTVR